MRVGMRDWLLVPLLLGTAATAGPPEKPKADLFLREMKFIETTRRDLRILVTNGGQAVSAATEVRLTLRTGATPKSVEVKIPPIPPGRGLWLILAAGPILPANTPLKSVPFSVEIDPGKKVDDRDRTNNEAIHNPK